MSLFHRQCDGVSRRDVIRLGMIGGASLTLSNYLRLAHAGAIAPTAKADAAIFVELVGGPSHIDMFDMKPKAPAEYRGSFRPIATNVPGIQICEHMPRLARCADKYAIVRGVSHSMGAHELGQRYINTGNRPVGALQYPGLGSMVARQHERQPELPSFVAIPQTNQQPGYLGVRYAALQTNATPRPGQSFNVRGISLSGGVTLDELQRRKQLLRQLDARMDALHRNDELMQGLDSFTQQAFDVIRSPRARLAFDVGQESPAFARPFGTDSFGMSCLLAIRLVEAGVRFVTVSLGGWDTHANNFTQLKDNLLPRLDEGLSAMLQGLEQRGLAERTSVLVTGEFGRTPRINDRSTDGGRDHHPRCMCMLLAGGPIRTGQVIGESDHLAFNPLHEAYSPDDVAATFFASLGIDPHSELDTPSGRPVQIVRDGNVIRNLLT